MNNTRDITTGRFNIGDRVTKIVDVTVPDAPTMTGTVERRYKKMVADQIVYAEVYDVRFDNHQHYLADGTLSAPEPNHLVQGLLPDGLTPAP